MKLKKNIRFITAASLFDGHDAAIHIMRRILQSEGAEVIHLGHNRSAQAVVKAAVEEDAQAIAISSYQGGHVEYFTYMLDLLKNYNKPNIHIFGGGGGVITKSEIKSLESQGIKKIFSPDDGIKLGLIGMIQHMLEISDHYASKPIQELLLNKPKTNIISQTISTLELGLDTQKNPEFNLARTKLITQIQNYPQKTPAPIIGITGTGGAGKSSLIDELVIRFLRVFTHKKIAILSVDPTKAKTGGALLGDRIRMNSADNNRVYVRSLATRTAHQSISKTTQDILKYLALLDFDLVILETAGIGQSDSSAHHICDGSIYVMTPEFGAPSQLEKIDMLDFADLVVINKFDRPGSLDALRDVRKAYQRNQKLFSHDSNSMPVFGTSAHIFADLGTNKFFNNFINLAKKLDSRNLSWEYQKLPEGEATQINLIPKKNSRYLANIAESVREHHDFIQTQAQISKKIESLDTSLDILKNNNNLAVKNLIQEKIKLEKEQDKNLINLAKNFKILQHNYIQDKTSYQIRDKNITINNFHISLSQLKIPKIITPNLENLSDIIKFIGTENLPGYFPFTSGVFPFKRTEEDPTRMFAGEGSPERTNKRFHFLSKDHKATRLSTAFDSVTLYGENPNTRPDIYGKIGNAGVSVCSLDDAKRLYSGFDLCAPNTSVSMTINGPAPTILAFYFNAAIDFQVEKELKSMGQWPEIQKKITNYFKKNNILRPTYRANNLPENHDNSGLGFLGIPSSLIINKNLYEKIKKQVLQNLRGTIQADILKEDQAQNTCIFSTEFSLRMMGDCQEYFIKNNIKNFYSVSISGYHIAEAGANPISQLAFTLANGFTLLEYYRSRGMHIDDFAKNFSFFFSNGVDPEYAVIGRVARRIWAIALKNIYKSNTRSQKLKYHIQTSGRSLHAQEMAFNDIRTTLQALYAICDNCNSLHTNAYDEAITTPTEESVRRAVAIQMVINHELGLTKNENPLQGSYFIEYLTNLVEEKVLQVFENLDARGGVLGAMETMYQRSTIQEESLFYEHQKHTGELPIIGVNKFLEKNNQPNIINSPELMRSTDQEKQIQVEQINNLSNYFKPEREQALKNLQIAALNKLNTFDALIEAAKFASLGEITNSFFQVGGSYRRAM